MLSLKKNNLLYSNYSAIVISLVSCFVLLVTNSKYGSAIAPYSINYLEVAKNIVEGRGIVFPDGKPLLLYSPLYPLVIASTAWLTGASVLFSVQLLSNIYLFITFILINKICKIYLGENIISTFAAIFLSLSNLIFEAASSVLTEELSVLLVCLTISSYIKYNKGSEKYIYLLGLFVGLGVICRYAFVINVFIFGIVVLIDKKNCNRFRDAIKYFITALLPLSIWLLRTYFLTGSFTGTRGSTRFASFYNIMQLVHSIIQAISLDLHGTVGYIIAVIFILSFIYIGIKNKKEIINTSSLLSLYTGYKELFVFVALSILFLFITSSLFAFDTINTRLLLPIYIPVVIIAGSFVNGNKLYKISSVKCICMVYMAASVITTGFMTYQKASEGTGGYGCKMWQDGETFNYASALNMINIHFYSNVPEILLFYEKNNALHISQKYYYN